jgi:hypothetical protein
MDLNPNNTQYSITSLSAFSSFQFQPEAVQLNPYCRTKPCKGKIVSNTQITGKGVEGFKVARFKP